MMGMQKRMLLLFFLLVIVSGMGLGLTYSNSAQVRVTIQSQTPDPAEPGEIITVKFKVENQGTQTKQEAVVTLLPQYPFSLYGDVAERNVGVLQAGSTGANAAIIEYKLKIDENAAEGEVELELAVRLGEGGISYTENEFLIDIQTRDAVLEITAITSDPADISPGETATLSIMVKNLADSLLKDIKFKLDLSDKSLPLSPYQSSSERRLAQLQSGFQNSLRFKIIADPDAAPGLYKVPLNITYSDEQGNSLRVEDVLSITIGGTPHLRPSIKKSSVLQANKPGKITIEIANAGTMNIKFLELHLLPSDDFTLISTSRTIYVGDIDSDDTHSEEIELFINKGVEKLTLPVELQFYDANNKPYRQSMNLELPLYSSRSLKKFGILKNGSWGLYFILILLAAGGYFYYTRYHKKKKK